MYKSGAAIMRSYIMYRSHLIFIGAGTILLVCGFLPFVRYGILYLSGDQGDHLQSLLVGVILLFASIIAFALAVIANLLQTNRTIMEDIAYNIKIIKIHKDK